MNRDLNYVLRRLLPPAVSERLLPVLPDSPTWRGVYPSFRDVPTVDGTFDNRVIGRMAATTRNALASMKAGQLPWTWHEPLTLTASTIAARQGYVRVLDFGGGVGEGFVQLLASLPDEVNIKYVVVDLEPACAAGRQLFSSDGRIEFTTDFPETQGEFDIAYANTVLQYIEDYRGMLRRLAGIGAPWVLLGQLAAGKFRTFATEQVNLPGQILPYQFLDVDEVVAILLDGEYDLVCQTVMQKTYDQRNFPPSLRSERMRNMLFLKRSAHDVSRSQTRADI